MRAQLFCLIYVHNKLKITTKNSVMSFKPFTEKNVEEKNWNLFDFRSDPDPLSRKRIRGSGYGSETLIPLISKTRDNFAPLATVRRKLESVWILYCNPHGII